MGRSKLRNEDLDLINEYVSVSKQKRMMKQQNQQRFVEVAPPVEKSKRNFRCPSCGQHLTDVNWSNARLKYYCISCNRDVG